MGKRRFIMETTPQGWTMVGEIVYDAPPVPVAQLPAPPPDPTPDPPAVLGWKVGDCHTFTKEGKSVLNKQLYRASFRWNANLRISRPQRYRNGRVERFEIRHYAFTSVATRVS